MIYIGTVTQVSAEGPMLQVPDLGGDLELGPAESLDTGVVIAAGDRVAVSSIGTIRDDLIILGKLTLFTTP